MTTGRASRAQLAIVMAVLIVLHFYLRPRLWDARVSPDFIMIGLMLFSMRSRPGDAAIAGFAVGLMTDALSPAHFGAASLACTLVAYAASWGRAVFFADNLLVNAGMIAAGVWLRNAIVLGVSGAGDGQLVKEVLVFGPLQAALTAGCGVVILWAFREWFAIRLDV